MLFSTLQKAGRRLSLGHWRPTATRLRDSGVIAITIDDGPSPRTTPRLLDILKAHDATASFFLCGHRVEAYPELVDAIARAGHGIYSHGFSHGRMDHFVSDDFFRELDLTEALLGRHRPAPSPYMLRLPYGSGHRSRQTHRLLGAWRSDSVLVHWRASLQDWVLADGCPDIDALRKRCEVAADKALARPDIAGAIILMHEDPIDVCAPLAAEIAPLLLEAMLTRLPARGLRSAGLGRIVRPPAYSAYLQTERLQ